MALAGRMEHVWLEMLMLPTATLVMSAGSRLKSRLDIMIVILALVSLLLWLQWRGTEGMVMAAREVRLGDDGLRWHRTQGTVALWRVRIVDRGEFGGGGGVNARGY